MLGFIQEIMAVWRRQVRGWRMVVTWMIANRFLRKFVEQYASIYITLLGASPVQLGVVQSSVELASTSISLPMGLAQDRYSLRTIYLAGIALTTTVPLLYAVAPSWQWLIPAAVVMGLGRRLGACAVICDVSLPNRDRATGKAICEGLGALPTLLAPALGAALIVALGGVTAGGIRTLYWLYFLMGLVPTAYVLKNLPAIHREQRASVNSGIWGEYREVFQNGVALKRYLVFVGVKHFTLVMIMTFMYPYAYTIGSATPLILGAMSTAATLTEACFGTVFGRMADRLGRKRIYFLLTPALVASSVLFILSPTPFWLVTASFLFGFRMIASIVYSSMAPEIVPQAYIGRWRGIISFCMGIGGLISPIAGGYLWERFGAHYVFLAAIFADAIISVPLLYSIPESIKPSLAAKEPQESS